MEAIYYTKMMFRADGAVKFNIFLNIPQKEISYEKYDLFGKVVWNHGVKLNDNQINKLTPFINALDFEPYRDKEPYSDFSEGIVGYRDEYWMDFIGITDSYIPKIELPMTILYDEVHIWPNERLYQYLIKSFLSTKKLRIKGLEL